MATADFDVVVVGGGAAGIAAARSARLALPAGGATVALVADGAGATELGAGWIAPGPGDGSVALGWLAEVGLRAPGDYAFATATGALVRAVSGVASLLDLASLPAGALAVLDVAAGAAWSAELVAHSLRELSGRATRVITPGALALSAPTARELAHALDTEGLVDALGLALRDARAESVAVLCPPALGLARDDVAARLSARAGVPVGETGGLAQDPPGIRLARAVARGLPQGVERISGRARVETDGDGARVRVGERVFRARAVVLATGGLAGGGVVFDGAFDEPCVGAPVWLPGTAASDMVVPARATEWGVDPQPLFAPDAAGRSLATGAGVRLDAQGRVLSVDGRRAEHPWLFAAGGVVAGGAGAYGATLGEALAQGFVAGARAARFARE